MTIVVLVAGQKKPRQVARFNGAVALTFQKIIPLLFADGHFEFFHHGQHVFPDFALTSKPNGGIIGT
ncbi:MAG: hypothetical protein ABSH11_10905 [Verrucomicrobiota bacterium]|jgi:hypothetical protein